MELRNMNFPPRNRLIEFYENGKIYMLVIRVARLLEMISNAKRGVIIYELQKLEKNRKSFKLSQELMKMENSRLNVSSDCPPPSYFRVLFNNVQTLPSNLRLPFLNFLVNQIDKITK